MRSSRPDTGSHRSYECAAVPADQFSHCVVGRCGMFAPRCLAGCRYAADRRDAAARGRATAEPDRVPLPGEARHDRADGQMNGRAAGPAARRTRSVPDPGTTVTDTRDIRMRIARNPVRSPTAGAPRARGVIRVNGGRRCGAAPGALRALRTTRPRPGVTEGARCEAGVTPGSLGPYPRRSWEQTCRTPGPSPDLSDPSECTRCHRRHPRPTGRARPVPPR